MYNENVISQSTTDFDWTDIDILWDEFTTTTKMAMKPGNLKKKAAFYLGANNLRYLDRKTIRELSSKKRKIRKSSRKKDRARSHALTNQINWYLNFFKK